jgi:hypothetical protein
LNTPSISRLLRNKPTESRAIALICILAIARATAAIIVDATSTIVPSVLLVEIGLLLIFLALFRIALLKTRFRTVHPLFGLLVIAFLGYNFLQFGGVMGTNSFNYFAGIYVIVMLYSGRLLYGLLALLLIVAAFLSYLVYVEHPVYEAVLVKVNTESSTEFLFSVAAIALFTYYLKSITTPEIVQLESKSTELGYRVAESRALNQDLINTATSLRDAQQRLRDEVARRTNELEKQNTAIQEYIYHNTRTITGVETDLSAAMENFKGNSQLHLLLQISHLELKQVILEIKTRLETNEKLERSHINTLTDGTQN